MSTCPAAICRIQSWLLVVVAVTCFLIGRSFNDFFDFSTRPTSTSFRKVVKEFPAPGRNASTHSSELPTNIPAINVPSISYDIFGSCALSDKVFPHIHSVFSDSLELATEGFISIENPQSLHLISHFEGKEYRTRVSYQVCGTLKYAASLPIKMLPAQLCKIFSYLVFNHGIVSICGEKLDKKFVHEYCGEIPVVESDPTIRADPFSRSVDKTFLFWNKALAAYTDYSPSHMVDSGHELPYADYVGGVESNSPTIYYVVMTQVPEFIRAFQDRITHPFLLITGSSDDDAPFGNWPEHFSMITKFLENPLLVAWLCQNLGYFHPKVVPIPIGFDFHTYSRFDRDQDRFQGFTARPQYQDEYVRTMNCEFREDERKQTVFVNFNADGRPNREQFLSYISVSDPMGLIFHKTHGRMKREKVWHRYRTDGFVASPVGVGRDCHRTWEALAQGAPVIIQPDRYLDVLFRKLPVFSIDAWSSVNSAHLRSWTNTMYQRWDSYEWEIIRTAYWYNLAVMMLRQKSTSGFYNVTVVDNVAVDAEVSLFAHLRA